MPHQSANGLVVCAANMAALMVADRQRLRNMQALGYGARWRCGAPRERNHGYAEPACLAVKLRAAKEMSHIRVIERMLFAMCGCRADSRTYTTMRCPAMPVYAVHVSAQQNASTPAVLSVRQPRGALCQRNMAACEELRSREESALRGWRKATRRERRASERCRESAPRAILRARRACAAMFCYCYAQSRKRQANGVARYVRQQQRERASGG